MKAYRLLPSLLMMTQISAADPSPCDKDLTSPMGSVRSVQASYPNEDTGLCDVSLSNSNSDLYNFQAGGIVHTTDTTGNKIHSFVFLTNNPESSKLESEGAFHFINQSGLQWKFSNNFELKSIEDTSTSKQCLGEGRGPNKIQFSAERSFDLGACDQVIAIDLGTSDSSQTAALKRRTPALIKGVIGGRLRTCEVATGHLFDYQSARRVVPQGKTVIVSQTVGYDPCYLNASKAYPGLPPNQSLPAYKQAHPNDPCITFTHASLNDFPVHYSAIPEGLSSLSGSKANEMISYHTKAPAPLAAAIRAGKGSGCGALAAQVSSGATSNQQDGRPPSSAPTRR